MSKFILWLADQDDEDDDEEEEEEDSEEKWLFNDY